MSQTAAISGECAAATIGLSTVSLADLCVAGLLDLKLQTLKHLLDLDTLFRFNNILYDNRS